MSRSATRPSQSESIHRAGAHGRLARVAVTELRTVPGSQAKHAAAHAGQDSTAKRLARISHTHAIDGDDGAVFECRGHGR